MPFKMMFDRAYRRISNERGKDLKTRPFDLHSARSRLATSTPHKTPVRMHILDESHRSTAIGELPKADDAVAFLNDSRKGSPLMVY